MSMDKSSPGLLQTTAGDALPTCAAACPVHTDTREYVQRVSRGDYEGALDILLEVNPFPSVCGRICHHPCESHCRRAVIDEAVSLRMIKRFIVENTREYRIARRRKAAQVSKEKTAAVIGAGPSGLTAAMDLALRGYKVKVYEKDSKLGGMLAHAIPRYRLPAEALAEDIEDILASGIEVHSNCSVGQDISFEQLKRENDAVLIAVGLSESHSLPIPGTGAKGVFLGVTFLWDVANGLCPEVGKSTLVIGGGNVAIDIARAAKRLGPEKVYMACLESREEMPAWKWEIAEAEEEGIEILNSWGPMAILEKDGAVTGVQFRRCSSVFDAQHRFSPTYDDSVINTVEVDSVILGIGQKANLDFLTGSAVSVNGGRLICNRETAATSEPGVFACGEVMTGPGSAIQAVGTGHDAAKVVSHYLETGKLLKLSNKKVLDIGELPAVTAANARRLDRVCVELSDPAERIKDFSPIEPVYTEEEALSESRRCLSCATGAHLQFPNHCAGCLTCVRICPFGVAQVRRTAFMPPQQCQTCGLCAAECPAFAIDTLRFPSSVMKKAMVDSVLELDLARISRPFLISYCCVNGTTSRKYLGAQSGEEIMESGILRVLVPCVGRLSMADLVSPFELGADKVAVVSCPEDGCYYPRVESWLDRRIKRTQKYLDQIGVGADNLQLFKMEGSGDESWPRIWEKFRALNLETAVGKL
jgi:NADPH-dependent glutamate synthase beta subunit-like oxidoreductase/coenzyme F420-reducing hydrogenase delta subunit